MKAGYDIAVIGGGASGMTAAITAARAGCRVCLLEALPRVGKKLLATGNGRCNISNISAGAASCRTDSAPCVEQVFALVAPQRVWDFLSSLGIALCQEDEGRMYPRSGQASCVLDMFRCELERLGVTVICEAEVSSVRKSGGGYSLMTAQGTIKAKRVIFAGGGKAAPQLGGSDSTVRMLTAMGHTSRQMRPSLVPMRCPEAVLRSLKGVRVRCKASIICKGKELHSDFGEVQFADGAISGIVVFQLSARLARAGGTDCQLSLDLMPELSPEETEVLLVGRHRQLGHLSIENFLSGLLNKKIGIALLKGITDLPMTESADKLTQKQLHKLAGAIKSWSFTISGAAPWQQAQCMSGGIRVDEFDRALQSRIQPGIFACGELLDCDCDCGGYNLHWAWTSGIAAGEGAARSLGKEQY